MESMKKRNETFAQLDLGTTDPKRLGDSLKKVLNTEYTSKFFLCLCLPSLRYVLGVDVEHLGCKTFVRLIKITSVC